MVVVRGGQLRGPERGAPHAAEVVLGPAQVHLEAAGVTCQSRVERFDTSTAVDQLQVRLLEACADFDQGLRRSAHRQSRRTAPHEPTAEHSTRTYLT